MDEITFKFTLYTVSENLETLHDFGGTTNQTKNSGLTIFISYVLKNLQADGA